MKRAHLILSALALIALAVGFPRFAGPNHLSRIRHLGVQHCHLALHEE